MKIFVTKKGERLGPYSEAEVRQHLASGKFTLEDRGWYDGLFNWQPLRTILGTSSGSTEPHPPPLPHRTPFRRYAVIGVVALFIIYVVSPYVSFWRLRNALQSGDRDALESQIDFPSVRESLKDQLRVQMAKSMMKDEDLKDNPFGGLATALAPMIVNYFVDNFVTPAGIAAVIADSKSTLKQPVATVPTPTEKRSIEWSKVRYAFFVSPTQFMVDIDGTKLRFGFTGFGWQLRRIDIPLQDARRGQS